MNDQRYNNTIQPLCVGMVLYQKIENIIENIKENIIENIKENIIENIIRSYR